MKHSQNILSVVILLILSVLFTSCEIGDTSRAKNVEELFTSNESSSALAESSPNQSSNAAPKVMEEAPAVSSGVSVKNPAAIDLMDMTFDQLSSVYGQYTVKEKVSAGYPAAITFECLPNYIFFTDTDDLCDPPDKITLFSVDEKDNYTEEGLFNLTENIRLGMTLSEIQQKFGSAISQVPSPDVKNEYVMDVSGYKLYLFFDSFSKLREGFFENDALREKERTSGFVINDNMAMYTAMHKQQGFDYRTAALYGKIDAMNEWKLLYYTDSGQWQVAGMQNFYKYHSDLGKSIWYDFGALLKHFNVKVSDRFSMNAKYALTPLPDDS